MLLKATPDDLEIIRAALTEYTRSLRDQSRPFASGYSETGITLCVRRLQVEDLMLRLEERPPARTPIRMPVAVSGRQHENEAALLRDAA